MHGMLLGGNLGAGLRSRYYIEAVPSIAVHFPASVSVSVIVSSLTHDLMVSGLRSLRRVSPFSTFSRLGLAWAIYTSS